MHCMFDCIHVMFFSSWKTVFKQFQHLSTPSLSIELFSCFLSQSWHLSIAKLINRETFYPIDSSSTATFIHRGLLDTSRSVEILLHVLFFTCFASFLYLVIHSILFHYMHAFIWILCTPLIIFMFLGWSFITSCTLCQSWQKGEEIVETLWFLFLRFYMLGGEIHAFVRGRCVSSC